MLWKMTVPEEPKHDRHTAHAECMALVETFRSPVRELFLAILPGAYDPIWERGCYAVKEEYGERVRQFEHMYKVMQEQRPDGRHLRVVRDGDPA